MNFETNVLGALLLGFGYVKPPGAFVAYPARRSSISKARWRILRITNGEYWEGLTYEIPFAILNQVYGCTGLGSGSRIKGNFFTVCAPGDLRHAGTWNPTPRLPRAFGLWGFRSLE